MSGETNHTTRWVLAAISLPAFLVICGALSCFSTRPPDPLGPDADPTLFSASRAAEIVKTVAAHPHPIGSAAHDEVRDFLMERLRGLVDEAAIQSAELVSDYHRRDGIVSMATVQNLVGRLRGRESTTAVLLMAHYDSAPSSPGASDDGAGVAAILEALRALRQGPRLRNDLIVLLSDGEEVGLLGAQAFFGEHPLREQVRLVLNLEARGSRGPVVLFETSPRNGWLISEFSRADARPMANSLAYEAYKRMPNDTDLSIAKRAGYAGLNFAFTEGFYDYHSAGDSIDHLSLASLQQMGETCLTLTRRFGNRDLSDVQAPDVAYFNPFGRWLVRYPLWLHWAIAGVLLLWFLQAVVRGLRSGKVGIAPAALGAGGFLVAVILFLEASAILQGMVRNLVVPQGLASWKMIMSSEELLIAQFLLGLAVFALLVEWMRRGIRRGEVIAAVALAVGGLWWSGALSWPLGLLNVALGLFLYLVFRHGIRGSWSLTTGALLVWLLGFVVLAILAPGGAFLFGWPLLFALPVTSWAIGRPDGRHRSHWFVWLLIMAGAVPGAILLTDVAEVVQVNLGSMIPWIASVPVGLLLGLLLPLFSRLEPRARRMLAAASALCALVFLLSPLMSSFDTRYRRPAELFFLAEPADGFWATTDRQLGPWQQQVLGTPTRASLDRILPGRDDPLLLSEPHSVQADFPIAAPLSFAHTVESERIEFELCPAKGTARINLFPSGLQSVRSVSVNGMVVPTGQGSSAKQRWIYSAPPAEGLRIRLEADELRTLTLQVVQTAYRWPSQLEIPPRPAAIMSNPRGIPDATLTVRDWSFADLAEDPGRAR